jgi:hypothetical protein
MRFCIIVCSSRLLDKSKRPFVYYIRAQKNKVAQDQESRKTEDNGGPVNGRNRVVGGNQNQGNGFPLIQERIRKSKLSLATVKVCLLTG